MYQFYADYWRRQAEWAGQGIYCHGGLVRLSSRTNEKIPEQEIRWLNNK